MGIYRVLLPSFTNLRHKSGADTGFPVGGGANPWGGGANIQICRIFPKTA